MPEQDNKRIWNSVKRPPETALKQIKGGRLSGMTDINPQWRYEALTEQFGPCGFGWKYRPTGLRFEQGTDGQVVAFADVELFVKIDGAWSDPIPGSGGSMLIAKESSGLRTSDEAVKMATTDALSVACKMLGIGADIYAGRWDGSKYKEEPKPKAEVKNKAKSKEPEPKQEKESPEPAQEKLTPEQFASKWEKMNPETLQAWTDRYWPVVEQNFMGDAAGLAKVTEYLDDRRKELKKDEKNG